MLLTRFYCIIVLNVNTYVINNNEIVNYFEIRGVYYSVKSKKKKTKQNKFFN